MNMYYHAAYMWVYSDHKGHILKMNIKGKKYKAYFSRLDKKKPEQQFDVHKDCYTRVGAWLWMMRYRSKHEQW